MSTAWTLPRPTWAEQDIEAVWELAVASMGEAIAAAGVRDVAAIGLSVHGEAVTPVDAAGRPLRPTILGMDTRTHAQNEWLRERFGARELFARTGMPIHTINTLPKLLWIREHEPDIWAAADKFLLVEDFFIARMTGDAVVSSCLASRTQLYDLQAGGWSGEFLDALGLTPEHLAEVAPSGTQVGRLSSDLTDRLGLADAPGVVTGGHDQACGALGVGLTRPGLAMVSTGTAEVVEVALATPVVSEPLYEGNISVYRATLPGLFLAMTLNHSGGLALRWFRDGFCEPQVVRAGETDADAYDLILSGASAEPSGLLALPHFAGAGTPTFDTASRGAILGLTFSTSRTDIAKAILEGLTFELAPQPGPAAGRWREHRCAACGRWWCPFGVVAATEGGHHRYPCHHPAHHRGSGLRRGAAGRHRRGSVRFCRCRGGAVPGADRDVPAGSGPTRRLQPQVRALPRGLPGGRDHLTSAVGLDLSSEP